MSGTDGPMAQTRFEGSGARTNVNFELNLEGESCAQTWPDRVQHAIQGTSGPSQDGMASKATPLQTDSQLSRLGVGVHPCLCSEWFCSDRRVDLQDLKPPPYFLRPLAAWTSNGPGGFEVYTPLGSGGGAQWQVLTAVVSRQT